MPSRQKMEQAGRRLHMDKKTLVLVKETLVVAGRQYHWNELEEISHA